MPPEARMISPVIQNDASELQKTELFGATVEGSLFRAERKRIYNDLEPSDPDSILRHRDHRPFQQVVVANLHHADQQPARSSPRRPSIRMGITDGPVTPDKASSAWKSASNVTTTIPSWRPTSRIFESVAVANPDNS
jgi:hypothetical protein